MSAEQGWTLQKFFSELERRRVYRVAVGYLAVGWGLLEALAFFFERLDVPDSVLDIVLIVFALGFPIALLISWTYDITSDGIVKTAPEPGPRKLSALQFTEIGVILVLLVALSYLIVERRALPDRPAVEDFSVGVLPFLNMSSDPDNGYFSDGITEELLHALTGVKDLRVASRTSSFYFKDKSMEIGEIGRILGVATLLEGSVRKDGDQVRVTAQLIDASNGYHLWSGTYDSQLKNIFAVQSEVTRQVVKAITPLLLREAHLPPEPVVVDEVAFDLYLKGRARMRNWERFADLESARGHFQAAIERDAGFPLPYVGMCETNLLEYERYRDPMLFTEAEATCKRALLRQHDNLRDWEIHAALGELYRLAGEHEKSLESIRAGTASAGESQRLLLSKGMTLAAMGLPQQAETALKDAVALDGSNWDSRTVLGNFYYDQQRYSEAETQFRTVLEQVPDFASALIGLASTLYMRGDVEAAEATWLSAEQTAGAQDAGSLGNVYTNLGLKYYYEGDYARAVELQRRAIDLRPADHRPWGRLAESYRGLADVEAEREAYRQAIRLAGEELAINPGDTETLGLLGIYEAFSGNRGAAEQYRDRMLSVDPDGSTWLYFAALISLALNDPEKAWYYLERAVGAGLEPRFARGDPDLQRLRSMDAARFDALLARPD